MITKQIWYATVYRDGSPVPDTDSSIILSQCGWGIVDLKTAIWKKESKLQEDDVSTLVIYRNRHSFDRNEPAIGIIDSINGIGLSAIEPVIIMTQPFLLFGWVKQFYLAVEKESWKFDALQDVLDLPVTQAVVFCNTGRKVKWLTEEMIKIKFTVSAL
ncbi:hypothetical protein HK100_006716, partial [Physocladia obscura]